MIIPDQDFSRRLGPVAAIHTRSETQPAQHHSFSQFNFPSSFHPRPQAIDRSINSVSSPDRLNLDRLNPDRPSPDAYHQFWSRSATGMYRASLAGHFLEVNAAYAELLEYKNAVHLMSQVTCIAHEIYQSSTRWAELLTYLQQKEAVQGFESPVWTGIGTGR